MDVQTNTARHTTTIQVPMWLAMEIKNEGMTYVGAMVAGWNAIKERKTHNSEYAALRANMDKYRDAYLRLLNEVNQMRQDEQ